MSMSHRDHKRRTASIASTTGGRGKASAIRVSAPGATPKQRAKLAELGRRFCVVHATLSQPPIDVEVSG
jgi:hypothetical protein